MPSWQPRGIHSLRGTNMLAAAVVWVLIIQGSYSDSPLLVHPFHQEAKCREAAAELAKKMWIRTPVCLRVSSED